MLVHYINFDPKFTYTQLEFILKDENKIQKIYLDNYTEYDGRYGDQVLCLKRNKLFGFIVDLVKCRHVFINGIFNKKITLLLISLPCVLHKSTWIPWGSDLYWDERKLSRIKFFIYHIIFKSFCQRVGTISSPTRNEFETVKKRYSTRAKYLDAGCNIFSFEKNSLDILNMREKKFSKLIIQVGNSGDPRNNHIEVFEDLEKYKEKEIEIRCPLSYGDEEYINNVIFHGRRLFGDKFNAITKFLKIEEYNESLHEVNILILNQKEQQGFGNIVTALYLNTKVYIRKSVSIWDYIADDLKCKIYDRAELKDLSFDDFQSFDVAEFDNNRTKLAHLFDREWQYSNWKKLFRNVEK